MDLVDDVDLVAALGRREQHPADDLLAHVVDTGARRGVELVDVRVAPLGDLDALLAGAVGLRPWARLAEERLGQDPRGGGLAGAARSGEQVRVRDRAVGDRVSQRALDVLLPDDVVEGLRPVLAIQRLVRHAGAFQVGVSVRARSIPAATRHGGAARTRYRKRAERTRTLGRGRLWLLPSGPDQVRDMPPSEPARSAHARGDSILRRPRAHHGGQAVYSAVSVAVDSAACSAGWPGFLNRDRNAWMRLGATETRMIPMTRYSRFSWTIGMLPKK